MKVNFYATFRALAGKKTVKFDLPAGSTVRDLVAKIYETFPDFQGKLLDDEGELFRHVHIFINGRDTYYLPDNMDTTLSAEDKIDVFPPVGGGCA